MLSPSNTSAGSSCRWLVLSHLCECVAGGGEVSSHLFALTKSMSSLLPVSNSDGQRRIMCTVVETRNLLGRSWSSGGVRCARGVVPSRQRKGLSGVIDSRHVVSTGVQYRETSFLPSDNDTAYKPNPRTIAPATFHARHKNKICTLLTGE